MATFALTLMLATAGARQQPPPAPQPLPPIRSPSPKPVSRESGPRGRSPRRAESGDGAGTGRVESAPHIRRLRGCTAQSASTQSLRSSRRVRDHSTRSLTSGLVSGKSAPPRDSSSAATTFPSGTAAALCSRNGKARRAGAAAASISTIRRPKSGTSSRSTRPAPTGSRATSRAARRRFAAASATARWCWPRIPRRCRQSDRPA